MFCICLNDMGGNSRHWEDSWKLILSTMGYSRYMAHKIPKLLLRSVFISYLSKFSSRQSGTTLLVSQVSHSTMLRGIMTSLTLFNSKKGSLRVRDNSTSLLLLGGLLVICFLLSSMSIKEVKDVQSFLSNFKRVEESGTFFPLTKKGNNL